MPCFASFFRKCAPICCHTINNYFYYSCNSSRKLYEDPIQIGPKSKKLIRTSTWYQVRSTENTKNCLRYFFHLLKYSLYIFRAMYTRIRTRFYPASPLLVPRWTLFQFNGDEALCWLCGTAFRDIAKEKEEICISRLCPCFEQQWHNTIFKTKSKVSIDLPIG